MHGSFWNIIFFYLFFLKHTLLITDLKKFNFIYLDILSIGTEKVITTFHNAVWGTFSARHEGQQSPPNILLSAKGYGWWFWTQGKCLGKRSRRLTLCTMDSYHESLAENESIPLPRTTPAFQRQTAIADTDTVHDFSWKLLICLMYANLHSNCTDA